MSSFHKMQKNINDYHLDQLYRNMTPQQHRESIKLAVEAATEELTQEYNMNLKRLAEAYNKQVKESVHITVDTFMTEFLYELGLKLECYIDEPQNMEQKVDLVQAMYEDIMKSIQGYVDIKEDDKAYKEFQRKREVVKKTFNIFKDGDKNG